MRVGVLSDTHGLLRPRVLELLTGCDRILHAGDVGSAEVLARLREVAPVDAVRGNVDTGPDADELPFSVEGELAGLPFRMVKSVTHAASRRIWRILGWFVSLTSRLCPWLKWAWRNDLGHVGPALMEEEDSHEDK